MIKWNVFLYTKKVNKDKTWIKICEFVFFAIRYLPRIYKKKKNTNMPASMRHLCNAKKKLPGLGGKVSSRKVLVYIVKYYMHE